MNQQEIPKRFKRGNYIYLLGKAYCTEKKIYKVGETQGTPNTRRCQVSSHEKQKYKVLAYYLLDEGTTKTQRVAIEHGVKNDFEKNGYENVQNDFYKIEKGHNLNEKTIRLFYESVTRIVEKREIKL